MWKKCERSRSLTMESFEISEFTYFYFFLVQGPYVSYVKCGVLMWLIHSKPPWCISKIQMKGI